MDIAFVERHQLTTQPLTLSIPVYNINGTLNEAGSIWCVTECILCYCNHAEWAVFAITSLGKQDIILGYTWLCLHNLDIDWSIGEVKMSQCPHQCSTYMEEAWLEHCAHAQEQASVQACQWGPLLYSDLDLLDPLPFLTRMLVGREETPNWNRLVVAAYQKP